MSTQDKGGPAFPFEYHNQTRSYQNGFFGTDSLAPGASQQFAGMTLRDYFAAKAMQAAATNPTGADGFTFSERAEWAYQQADAMLKVRQA